MIFVIIDEKINDFGPILKGFTTANEKILFVKNVQDLIFKIFNERIFLLE